MTIHAPASLAEESAVPVTTATGYRLFVVDGTGPRRLPFSLCEPASSDVLIGPISRRPWMPGWQRAECEDCETVAASAHFCGFAFFPTLGMAVRCLAPSPFQNSGDWRFAALSGYSVALARIETRGPWVADSEVAAYRAPEARVCELWAAPRSRTSAADLASHYGVTAHQGTGPTDEWLLGLVPWGSAALPCHRFEADAEEHLTPRQIAAKLSGRTDELLARAEALANSGYVPGDAVEAAVGTATG
jgi:hypothetical protein